MPMFAPGYFDMIWASPPCAEYSRALTRRPCKLEEGDRTAIRTLEVIRDLRPRFWCIENPQTGLLKRRPFMANLQWSDVTYCKYGYPYKKATRLWHWEPEHGPAARVSFRGPLVTPRGLQGHALSTVTVPRHSGHPHFSRHCSSESVWLEPKPSAA